MIQEMIYMVNRTFALLLVCLLGAVCVPSVPAYADVVFTVENSFYERHKNECVLVKEVFCFPGEESVSIKQAPGSATEVKLMDYEVTRIKNYGYYVLCVYNYKGTPWGYVDHVSHGGSFSGWIPLNGAMLADDENSFLEDYRNAFYDYPGSDEDILKKLESVDQLVFWRWPCSGKAILDWGGLICRVDNAGDIRELGNYDFSNAFKDAEDREWIHFENDWKIGWICLDDPGNANIPASISNPKPWLWNPEDFPEGGISTSVLIIIFVAVAVVGSAVLILVFWKPHKKKTGTSAPPSGGDDEND